jgi:glyoxylase-like metal-dependent hydrolase (beta-lactamase superfamily II)
MPRVLLACLGLILLMLALPTTAPAQQASPTPVPTPPPPPVVDKLADDVYVFRQSGYNSLVILTDEGVVTTEPSSQFNTARSANLKAEIAKLTSQPVRWVIYSHDHRDHNQGGDVFADTATFIAHTRAAPKIAARTDGHSPVPTVLFDDKMTISPGGKQIELMFLGRNHSDNSIVVFYPARKVVFAVDWAEANRLPFRTLDDSYLDDWLASLTRLEQLDFTTLVAGHTGDGTKANVRALREYFLDLFTAIRGARLLGHADNSTFMNDYVRSEMAPKYRGWGSFDMFLPENVQGVIRIWRGATTP